jgi:hypothetical protein
LDRLVSRSLHGYTAISTERPSMTEARQACRASVIDGLSVEIAV